MGNKRKTVYQYTLDGVFLKEWNGIRNIVIEEGVSMSNISTAIKRNGTCFGYIWSYEKKEYIIPKIKYQMPIKYKNIKQIDKLTGEVIDIFDDALSIERKLNLTTGAKNKIYECINKKIKTAYGYKWEI
jgi:hypothetical protein